MTTVQEVVNRIDEIRAAIQQGELPPAELEEIATSLEELKTLVEPRMRKSSIRELKGLGKEIWRSIDVDEYIREERRSWR